MYRKISELTDGIYPFHMPGHKRNPDFLKECPDITEITGADDLHHPKDLILSNELRAATFFGTRRTFFGVSGSTSLILAAIGGSVKSKGNIYIARNCHRSVYNAVYVNSLNAGYIMPEWVDSLGCYGAVSPESVEAALSKVKTDAVVITSPTYEGIVSDINSISKICHKYGALLIVDAAHGAHLGLSEYFSPSARSLGADIVIESAHKTLPCLTGAALLHICSEKVPEKAIERAFSVYVSSSPSYPIMSSISFAVRELQVKGENLFRLQSDRLDDLYRHLSVLRCLSIYRADNHDKSKIIINCKNSKISGFELKKRLLQDYKIECEMAMPNFILALSTVCDTALGFDKLAYALTEIDRDIEPLSEPRSSLALPSPLLKLPIRRAIESQTEVITLENSVGKVSADFVYAYPPGSPIIAPGEVITAEIIHAVNELISFGADVYSASDNTHNTITVVK